MESFLPSYFALWRIFPLSEVDAVSLKRYLNDDKLALALFLSDWKGVRIAYRPAETSQHYNFYSQAFVELSTGEHVHYTDFGEQPVDYLLRDGAGLLHKVTGYIPGDANKGIGPLVGKVCLPMLIFRNVAKLDLSSKLWRGRGSSHR